MLSITTNKETVQGFQELSIKSKHISSSLRLTQHRHALPNHSGNHDLQMIEVLEILSQRVPQVPE